jgi:hypothetical protein
MLIEAASASTALNRKARSNTPKMGRSARMGSSIWLARTGGVAGTDRDVAPGIFGVFGKLQPAAGRIFQRKLDRPQGSPAGASQLHSDPAVALSGEVNMVGL